ncbi:MAG: FecR domain-containing protein [Cyclobacteriaceae bacterium]
MQYNKKKVEQIVEEFFQGKESRLGRELFNNWYKHENNELGEIPNKESIRKEIYQSIESEILDDKSVQLNGEGFQKQSLGVSFFLKVAASIILIVGVSYIFFNQLELNTDFKESAVQVEKSNARGERSTFRLPDGTIVKLNSDSKLTFAEDFDDKSRQVYLEGEAFFDVVKDANRPFMVHSSGVVTTALGTSFNVKAFDYNEGEDKIEVSLVTGKVSVRKTKGNVDLILIPGEQALIDGASSQKRAFEDAEVLAWKDGVIHFRDTGFTDIIVELERWYDVDFEVEGLDDSAGQRLKGTGKFNTQKQSLTTVLEVLSYSMNFKYEMNKKRVLIKF